MALVEGARTDRDKDEGDGEVVEEMVVYPRITGGRELMSILHTRMSTLGKRTQACQGSTIRRECRNRCNRIHQSELLNLLGER